MNPTAKQRGAGLIEVMVTVLILSTSLLGLAALQNRALQYNHSAYLRSQANILAYDLLDRIRINRKNASNYSLKLDDPTPSGAGLANADLSQWRGILADTLPGGTGGVSCDANQICTVTIQWQEQDGAAEAAENGDGAAGGGAGAGGAGGAGGTGETGGTGDAGDTGSASSLTTSTFKYTTRV